MPSGAFFHETAGEMLEPVQPKACNVYLEVKTPAERSGLEAVNVGAAARLATSPRRAICFMRAIMRDIV